MQPGCVVCSDTEGVEVVSLKSGPAFVCKIHNNPAAIADLDARHSIPAQADLPVESTEEK
jgi:hypothetical protein